MARKSWHRTFSRAVIAFFLLLYFFVVGCGFHYFHHSEIASFTTEKARSMEYLERQVDSDLPMDGMTPEQAKAAGNAVASEESASSGELTEGIAVPFSAGITGAPAGPTLSTPDATDNIKSYAQSLSGGIQAARALFNQANTTATTIPHPIPTLSPAAPEPGSSLESASTAAAAVSAPSSFFSATSSAPDFPAFSGTGSSIEHGSGAQRFPAVHYETPQCLRGLLLNHSTSSPRSFTSEFQHNVTWSLVTSFSPAIERHAELMFRDRFNECQFHAMGPAMSEWRGRIVTNVRLWLSQYMLDAMSREERSLDSWQENYVYSLDVDSENYQPLASGRLLALPTTTNAYARYRKDGPMDPRSFVFQNRLYLIYYSYGRESPGSDRVARMYMWDYENSIKTRLRVSGVQLQNSSEINWTPLVVRDSELYLIYTLDPLRVLQCDPNNGNCSVAFQDWQAHEYTFSSSRDYLRGGTPFAEYRHPYYASIAHSTVRTPRGWLLYQAHLVVVRVDPWRTVYVSEPIEANETWLQATPIVADNYIARPFWYPTALLLRDGWDTVDVGCHLSDYSSHVVRLNGIGKLLSEVVRADSVAADSRELQENVSAPAALRVVQDYVLECVKRSVYRKGLWYW